jgi:transposase
MPRKQYRPWNPDQTYLLPPSAKDLLPADHLVFFVRDLLNELDLSPIVSAIQAKDPRGTRPYNPRLMLWILIYGYASGIYSARKLEKATWEDLSFRVICGDSHPHFTTINEFRRQHRHAFSALFLGVLELCREAGMVKLGHVAIDGSKVKADASKHKASSYERLTASEAKLLAQIEEMLNRSDREDAEEDARFGEGRREFELPDDLKDATARLAKLRAARERIEQGAKQSRARKLRENAAGLRERAEGAESVEAKRKRTLADKAEAAADALAPDDDDEPPPTALPKHEVLAKPDGTPQPKQQTNFVDADSRLMKGRDGGFVQAYNVQIAVDEDHHVIVAEGVSNLAPDSRYLAPMVRRVIENTGAVPTVVTADAGYWSEAEITEVEQTGACALVARRAGRRTERGPPTGIGPPDRPVTGAEWMRWKMSQAPNRDIYRRRKSTVEPVFGNIKEARSFRQFSFRGLAAVASEWSLLCLVHNLLKLFKLSTTHRLAH